VITKAGISVRPIPMHSASTVFSGMRIAAMSLEVLFSMEATFPAQNVIQLRMPRTTVQKKTQLKNDRIGCVEEGI
jgi:hypothetical protein